MKKPSVTELTDLLNKPALLNWANKIGLQGTSLATYRKKSKLTGLSLHNQIESFFRYGVVMEKEDHQKSLELFLSDKKVIAFEKIIETDWFVGRYDLQLLWDKRYILCDFKSSDGLYFETVLQLVAYGMADNFDSLATIHIPTFKLREIDIGPNRALYEDVLKSLSTIYHVKNTLDWR